MGAATRDEEEVRHLFVASTHQPILFFTARGMVYRIKCWQIPDASSTGRGKPAVQLIPALSPDDEIAAVMPLPQDESDWNGIQVMFATSAGNVRRNTYADFLSVRANGKTAMRFEEPGERLVGVVPCGDGDDILLSTRGGRCIRFPVDEVRVFSSRTSTGVRGIRLQDGDDVISISTLRHAEFGVEERDAYLRIARLRRGPEEAEDEAADPSAEPAAASPLPDLDERRIAELAAQEQFLLSVTSNGFGKRSSSYEYRIAGRGGQGIANIRTSERNGSVVASFPVEPGDELLLVTDGGQMLRIGVDGIRIAGRNTLGVVLFRVEDGEQVASVSRIASVPEDGGQDAPAETIPAAK
jgi:DNA gyrase subunit A